MNQRVHVISYPKSGRTWLRVLVGQYLILRYNLPSQYLLELKRLCRKASLPEIIFTHAGAEWTSGTPPHIKDNIEYFNLPDPIFAKKDVVVLTRDSKDILVSAYFQATKREGVFTGSISEFIRDDRFGIKRVLTFYYKCQQVQHTANRLLSISYEQMCQSPVECLSHVLQFMGAQQIQPNLVKRSVDMSSFDSMQQHERKNKYNNIRLQPGNVSDVESYKVRRGKVGGYVEYLTQRDVEYIDNTTKEFEKQCIHRA